jgi:hypothetical protein
MAFRYGGGELLSLRGEHRRAGGRDSDGQGWIQRDFGDRFCGAPLAERRTSVSEIGVYLPESSPNHFPLS